MRQNIGSSWVACLRRAELFCLLTFPILADGDRKRVQGGRRRASAVVYGAGYWIMSANRIWALLKLSTSLSLAGSIHPVSAAAQRVKETPFFVSEKLLVSLQCVMRWPAKSSNAGLTESSHQAKNSIYWLDIQNKMPPPPNMDTLMGWRTLLWGRTDYSD